MGFDFGALLSSGGGGDSGFKKSVGTPISVNSFGINLGELTTANDGYNLKYPKPLAGGGGVTTIDPKGGLSTTTILLLGGGAIALFLLTRKGG